MRSWLGIKGTAAVRVLMVLAVSNFADSVAQEPAIVPSPAFSGKQLSALPQEGWLTNGGNLLNQRYSPLTEINRDNVAGLKAVWRASLARLGYSSQSRQSGSAARL